MAGFSFAQITDHHLLADEHGTVRGYAPWPAFRKVLGYVAENLAARIDFVVSTGDVVDTPDDATYSAVLQRLRMQPSGAAPGPIAVSAAGLSKMPMLFLPGNHDDRSIFYKHLFPQSKPGLMNARYEHKGVQFLTLDWGPGTKGVASAETLDFFAANTQAGQQTVVLTHHPVVKVGSKWLDEFLADDLERFWEIAKNGNVLGVLSGHVHMSYEQRLDEIAVYGTRATVFQFVKQDEPLLALQPPHIRVLTIKDGKLESELFEVVV
jgi:Icc protein